jgi:hypothetical protein
MSPYSIAKYLAGIAAALVLASVFPSIGCEPTLQNEGSRCNPDLAPGEGDCVSGLSCTQPPLCPENYCCPVDSSGNPTPSSNPFCQTGCSGGAASMCNVGADDNGECAFACANDPSDLADPSICAIPDAGPGPVDGAGDDSGVDAGGADSGGVDSGVADSGAADSGGPEASADASDGGAPDGGGD